MHYMQAGAWPGALSLCLVREPIEACSRRRSGHGLRLAHRLAGRTAGRLIQAAADALGGDDSGELCKHRLLVGAIQEAAIGAVPLNGFPAATRQGQGRAMSARASSVHVRMVVRAAAVTAGRWLQAPQQAGRQQQRSSVHPAQEQHAGAKAAHAAHAT